MNAADPAFTAAQPYDATKHRERVAQIVELEAVLGIPRDDAAAIARQFRSYPEQRRANKLLDHGAAVLRERRDRLAPNHLESLQRAWRLLNEGAR